MSFFMSLLVMIGGTFCAHRYPQLAPQITFFTGLIVLTLYSSALNESVRRFEKLKQVSQKQIQKLKEENENFKKTNADLERQIKMFKGEMDFASAEDTLLESMFESLSLSKTKIRKELDKRTADARTCIICMENRKNTVIIPCGHYMTCYGCTEALKHCPVCRQRIQTRVKTFQ